MGKKSVKLKSRPEQEEGEGDDVCLYVYMSISDPFDGSTVRKWDAEGKKRPASMHMDECKGKSYLSPFRRRFVAVSLLFLGRLSFRYCFVTVSSPFLSI